ncbi:hypothetical protein MKD33_20250, partial [Chromobacterium piscinae]
FRFDICGS